MTTVDAADRFDVRLVPAALTSWAVTAAGIVWASWATVLALLGAVVLTGLGVWWCSRWQGARTAVPAIRSSVLAVAVLGAGFALAVGLRVTEVREHPIADRYGADGTVVVVPSESPRVVGGGRMLFRGSLRSLDTVEMSGRVVVFASAIRFAELTVGQPARFRARISRPNRRDLTVAVLSATGRPELGEAAPVQRAAHAVRSGFADAARAALPADQAAVLPALVLGDTSALSRQTTEDFRTSGLTHLTAVSGANVTIVCGAVLVTAGVIGPGPAAGLAAVVLVAFVIVVQPSASVLRAAAMGGITLLAVLVRRRKQAIPALSATVIALLIGAPELAVDIGFGLSVTATAALVVIAPAWSRRLAACGWPEPLAAAVSVAAAAQLVTAPLIAGISGRFSVVAVLANLAVAVVIPVITLVGTAAAVLCAGWPAGAGLLIRFTGPELWWLLRVAEWTAGLPVASVPAPSGTLGVVTVAGAGVALVVLWRRRWVRIAVAVAALSALAWSVAAHAVGDVGAA